MFVCYDVADGIPVECDKIGCDFETTSRELSRLVALRFIDKVVQNFGLCVQILDILKVKPLSILGPNDGRAAFRVQTQMMFFHPVAREILHGRILKSDARGVRVSNGFFHDIKVPFHLLPEDSNFDEACGLWSWKVETEDRGETSLYMELGAKVRVRVEDVVYSSSEESESDQELTPMLVLASMKEAGLGCTDWWE